MKKNLDKIIIFLILIGNFFLFTKLPHVSWIPGFTGAWFLDKGLILYKDILQTHFPFTQFLLWPLLKITNWSLWVEPILALLIVISTSLYIYFKTTNWLSKNARALSVFFFSSFVWYFITQVQFCEELLIGLFILIIFIITINSFTKKVSNKKMFLLGNLFSITLLTGQIAIPVLFTLFLINLYTYRKKIYFLILGILIPILVVLTYNWLNNSLFDFYFWNIEYYLTYAKMSGQKEEILPWLDILFFTIPSVLLISKNKIKISFSLVGLSSIPLIIFSIFHPHHFLYSLPIMAICLGMALDKLKVTKIYLLFFSLYFIFYLVPWYTGRFVNTGKIVNLSAVSSDKNQLDVINWLQSNSKESDKIIVAGDPMFYFRSDRLPANKYFTVLPWHYNPLSVTTIEFDNKKPKYWIIDKSYRQRLLIGWKAPEIIDFIKKQLLDYELVYENTEWEIWRIKTRPIIPH